MGRRLVAGAILAVLLVGSNTIAVYGQGYDAEAERVSRSSVDDERTSRRIPSLISQADLDSIARDNSARMAQSGELRHSSDLPNRVGPYEALGENVGYGDDPERVHLAFMDSAEHRSHIIDPRYERIGVGAVRDAGGTVWITQIFFTPRDDGSPTTQTARSPRSGSSRTAQVERGESRTEREAPVSTTINARTPRPEKEARTVTMLSILMIADEPVVEATVVRYARPARTAWTKVGGSSIIG